ncbi:SDR family oxidoreductase [Alkalihalobacillus trypoxylicola]|uniref:Short-chain dehydrogenase n=1 Tax=Alkalihalobacillus trypoxylicola TaxID=519424 RepID=A0A162CML9_9BACI|nr:SDR family oxidoreductase [Alkalihalobacillus trypoxylicola]KYG25579.1 short-chain dehydrogenase [Alkalihalobacillus trypoxylicola]GAF66625.1 putative dehydrogenase [Bacillus sp. TS-2]
MNQKVIIITGANSGMGLATTISLAKKGATIIMACRSIERGKEALDQVKKESGSDSIIMLPCDLSSMESIRLFTQEVKEKYPSIDILINNAGVVTIKKEMTDDQFEMMLGVNHLGHFLLTNLLLNSLKKASDPRVINVSSGAYKAGRISLEDPFFHHRSFNVIKGYSQSKLANILFTKELAKREPTISTFSLHPGAVSTSLGVNRQNGFGRTIHKLLRPFFLTSEQGAETAIYLATEPNLTSMSGQYFYQTKPQTLQLKGNKEELATLLWDWSAKQVHL